jgi:hypothetical protein
LVHQDFQSALLLALRAEGERGVALAGLDPEQGGYERYRLAERFRVAG